MGSQEHCGFLLLILLLILPLILQGLLILPAASNFAGKRRILINRVGLL